MQLTENAPLFESLFSLDTFSTKMILLYKSLLDGNEKRATA